MTVPAIQTSRTVFAEDYGDDRNSSRSARRGRANPRGAGGFAGRARSGGGFFTKNGGRTVDGGAGAGGGENGICRTTRMITGGCS